MVILVLKPGRGWQVANICSGSVVDIPWGKLGSTFSVELFTSLAVRCSNPYTTSRYDSNFPAQLSCGHRASSQPLSFM
jgi:hypothetical protein